MKPKGLVQPPMTRHIYLIGHPVAHSVSPAFQQAALEHLAVDARYEAMDVPEPALPEAVGSLRDPNVLGANVTVPHKEAVIPFLDEVSDEARLIGAVNTIHNRGGALVGHNTDASGFLRALREEARFDPVGKSVLVLGAGGSAKAVTVALAGEGVSEMVVANRTLGRASALAESARSLGVHAEAIPLCEDAIRAAAARSRLIVNCTSLGMTGGPGEGQSPLEADTIPSEALVFDLVYNPRTTPLLREAELAGAQVLGGLPMLVYQGAAAFEIWTGEAAPVRVMSPAAEEALAARQSAGTVNGREFVRRARRYARRNGLEFSFDPSQGKGSHGTVYIGGFKTTVQYGEIKPGTLSTMLRQLNVNRQEFLR